MKKLLVFIFLFLSFFLFPKTVSANVLLWDNFNDGNSNDGAPVDWEEYLGYLGSWKIENGEYVGLVAKESTSDTPTYSVAGADDWHDYRFEVKIKGDIGVDKLIFFRYHSFNETYAIKLCSTWNDWYGDKVALLKNNLINWTTSAPFINEIGLWYSLSVEVKGNNIKLYINNSPIPIINYTDEISPNLTGKIGLLVWPGGYGGFYTANRFDDVLVTSLEPTPTPLQPLILLPGLGGSWNHQEIFGGIDQPQNAWHKTPFMDNYNALLQTLQNAGYILDENLFIFYYDWLQPIEQTAADLKTYIQTVVNPPPETKVDLLGHSMGGLVARTYVQNNLGSHQIDQLVTLGSPHKGAPQVYKAWEGAKLNGLLGDKERIGAGIVLRLRGFGYPNLVQAIRNLVPSLSNLLFIDDYLKWEKTGVIKPESSMSQQNTWLKDLGVSSELLGLTDTLVGTAGDTPRWLKIKERSQIDRWLGQWEDGKPVGEESSLGDNTVLEESARLDGANIITLLGLDHGELVKSADGQEKILELLGFTGVEVVEQKGFPFEPALVFALASPATLRVTDPLGRQVGEGINPPKIPNATFSPEEKIIIIPESLNGEYSVEVIAEGGGGPYTLLIGQLTSKKDIWTSHQGEVIPGSPKSYSFPVDNSLESTDFYLAKLINQKLKNLLRQIQNEEIGFIIKTKLSTKVWEILGQTTPLPTLLRFNQDEMAVGYTEKAILKTTETIAYAGANAPEVLPELREILDLLDQLHGL